MTWKREKKNENTHTHTNETAHKGNDRGNASAVPSVVDVDNLDDAVGNENGCCRVGHIVSTARKQCEQLGALLNLNSFL